MKTMKRWLHEISLNPLLGKLGDEFDLSRHEEPMPDAVKVALAKEIAKAAPIAHHAGPMRAAKSIAEGNRILARVFDDADRYGVWCGVPM